LPNLNKNASCNGDAVHIVCPTSSGGGSGVSDGPKTTIVKRTSSDGHVYFSPFKFTGSEC
jgi:hypothetical protein